MPTITFTLSDFGLASLASKLPTVKFVPSGAGVAGDRLFTSTPVTAVMVGDVGTVTLAATDGVTPTAWYTVQIEHLNPGGEYTHFDLLDFKVFVPEDYDGPLTGLPGSPLEPNMVLVSLSPPPTGYTGWYLNAPGPGNPPGDPNNPASSGTGILEIVS